MAAILVDYENVQQHNGLKGLKYLKPCDKLYLFYSNTCNMIRGDELEEIKRSRCFFKSYKLVNSGKNALDFYIATKCGMEYQNNETQFVIVSNDKGFHAVQDFIHVQDGKTRVIRSCNIELGLAQLEDFENVGRAKEIQANMGLVDIEQECLRMEAKCEAIHSVISALMDTKYESNTAKIVSFIEASNEVSKKQLYIRSLHEFGMKDGLELYQMLKNAI